MCRKIGFGEQFGSSEAIFYKIFKILIENIAREEASEQKTNNKYAKAQAVFDKQVESGQEPDIIKLMNESMESNDSQPIELNTSMNVDGYGGLKENPKDLADNLLFINNEHTECTFTTTHFNFNDGNGWVDNGPPIRTALYSMELTHSSFTGSLISSTDTALNTLDFSYIRIE